jgi:hypothetical protein
MEFPDINLKTTFSVESTFSELFHNIPVDLWGKCLYNGN